MKRSDEEISQYFQAISRFFLEHRGAPFFLSAKEVDTIKKWKQMGIPLQVVRDGIKECFGAQRKKSGRKGKIFTLSFCRPFVLRSYEAFKERKVGSSTKYVRRTDRRKELKTAVEGFLAVCPDGLPGLRKAYLRVLELITDEADEELFEELEKEVEALAVGLASAEERERIRNEVLAEFGGKSSQEQERIKTLKLIRYVREKYALPHISLYYY